MKEGKEKGKKGKKDNEKRKEAKETNGRFRLWLPWQPESELSISDQL